MSTFLFIFLFHIGLSFVLASEFTSSDDVSALLSIKQGIIDPMDRLKDWKAENHLVHCNWTGISCSLNGAVEKIDISNMNLSGILSVDIQNLHSLTSLNISCNDFSSSLPKSLHGLTSLKSFDVSQNDFVGGFPVGLGNAAELKIVNASSNNFAGLLPEDLANATLLESLDFRGSFFEGSIPLSYRKMQNLKFLGLSGNNLTGQIPRELGELKSLESIILGYNGFEGSIPAEFGNLTNLQCLDLAVGTLSGTIPSELGKLKQLNTIFLYKNKFEGSIPPEIGFCESLVLLDFSENQLTGELPEALGELKHLELLNVMSNKLTGKVPSGLGVLTKLRVLELWNNSLSGSLPEHLGKKSSLQWLDVSSNSLSGEIPSGLCDSGDLIKLILFNNAFSGPIPIGLSTCLSLVRVRIEGNSFSGKIPSGFGKLENLQRLELANNNLTGEIPGDIALSTSLSFIDLSKNHFDSSLPSSILSLPNLQTFMASNNNLEGQIPQQFQEFPSLTVIDLSGNQLSGSIPESIGSCQKLVTLKLGGNLFTGNIPRVIATMPTLAVLDLSNNSLSGTIPDNFGSSPALETLNVSYNKLAGPLPSSGILSTINLDDIKGNPGLCGGVLSPCSHSYSITSPREKSTHFKHIIAGWLMGVFALLTIVTTVLVLKRLRDRWYSSNGCFGSQFTVESGEWPWRMSAFQRLSFTSSEILASIKESNVIGMGATGIVYKAEMQRPHTIVAVKKLWSSHTDIETGSTNDLLVEVNLLGRLRHRNIVRLLGYLHNESNVMIVYEYMRNGSLGEVLHGKQSGKLLIDWVSRYNIAMGVAQALSYLHHDCNPPVIHRDVKSNNILLDENLDARIADFGIAKMMVHKNETVSMVAGSYGYIAPEYGYTLKVDEKSDVYSFGVVLMELLSGKRPVDPLFGESINIVEWIREKIRNKDSLEETLDLNVGAQCKLVQEEMLLVLRVALLCTAKLPKDRPSMRDVVTMLGEAKPRRKSVSSNNTSNHPNKDKPVFSTSPVAGLL